VLIPRGDKKFFKESIVETKENGEKKEGVNRKCGTSYMAF